MSTHCTIKNYGSSTLCVFSRGERLIYHPNCYIWGRLKYSRVRDLNNQLSNFAVFKPLPQVIGGKSEAPLGRTVMQGLGGQLGASSGQLTTVFSSCALFPHCLCHALTPRRCMPTTASVVLQTLGFLGSLALVPEER